MSKLDELIEELCPNGVEYRDLSDVCTFKKGTQLNRDSLLDEGEYPVINGGITPSGYWNEYNVEANTITISQGGASAGFVNYMETPFWAGAHCYYICEPIESIDYRYLYHVIKMYQFELMNSQVGAGIPSVSGKKLGSLQIPLPDLLIQREIVHILDSFTLLTAELTAELTARRQQYEFYRDYLLNFEADSYSLADDVESISSENISHLPLGEIATVTKLAGFEFTAYVKYSNEGKIIALRGLNVKEGHLDLTDVKYIDNSDLSKLNRSKLVIGDMLFTYVGTVGQVALIDKDDRYYLAPNVALIRLNDKTAVLPSYLKYFFMTNTFYAKQIQRLLQSSSMKNIPMEKIRKFVIPVPPLETQEKIVAILDRFDKLANDMSEGLPAEIEARKQQYEYYRDVLLSFDEERRSQLVKVERERERERELTRSKALKWLKLGEIATITRGGNFQKKDFTKTGKPCIHYGQIYTRYGISATETLTYISDDVFDKSKKAVKGDIVMAVTSENVEDVCKCVTWLGDEDIAVSGHTAIIHSSINPKYLAYYFHTSMFLKQKRKLAHGTKVIEVTPDKLKDVVIPVPSLEEQERIVSILDRFDKLCNDISEGIPAEIEARQKQYEYYRDKLLTFKEKK